MIDGRLQMVVVPMRDHHPLTRRVVRRLVADGEVDRLIIVDNETRTRNGRKWLARVNRGRFGDGVEVRRRAGNGIIYRVWNEAWRDALAHREETGQDVDLLILNNDLNLPEGLVGHLSRGLRSGVLVEGVNAERSVDDVWIVCPDWQRPLSDGVDVTDPPLLRPVFGTFRAKGISGSCFMIKPEKHDDGWPFVDERFRWYAGDGDLVQQAHLRGATGARVVGLPLGWARRTTSHDDRNREWVNKLIPQDMALSRQKYGGNGAKREWRRRWIASTNE